MRRLAASSLGQGYRKESTNTWQIGPSHVVNSVLVLISAWASHLFPALQGHCRERQQTWRLTQPSQTMDPSRMELGFKEVLCLPNYYRTRTSVALFSEAEFKHLTLQYFAYGSFLCNGVGVVHIIWGLSTSRGFGDCGTGLCHCSRRIFLVNQIEFGCAANTGSGQLVPPPQMAGVIKRDWAG